MHPRVLPRLAESGSEEIVPRGRDVARAGEQEQRQTQSHRGHLLAAAEAQARLLRGPAADEAADARSRRATEDEDEKEEEEDEDEEDEDEDEEEEEEDEGEGVEGGVCAGLY